MWTVVGIFAAAFVAYLWVILRYVQYRRLRAFSVGEPRAVILSTSEVPSFLPDLFQRGRAKLESLGFVSLGYLRERSAIQNGDREIVCHVLRHPISGAFARQMDVGFTDPAWPAIVCFESYLPDGTELATLDGMEANLHASSLSHRHHSRALTIDGLYQDHLEEVAAMGGAVCARPTTLEELLATDRELSHKRWLELEESGVLETGPDGVRRFRRMHLVGLLGTWIRETRRYGKLVAQRAAIERARNPLPASLPPAYEADLRRRAAASAQTVDKTKLQIVSLIFGFLLVSLLLHYRR